MYDLLAEFPRTRCGRRVAIGTSAALSVRARGIARSSSAASAARRSAATCCGPTSPTSLTVPFIVNRHYTLPAFVGPRHPRDHLQLLRQHRGDQRRPPEALKRKARILCISSNGTTEQLARKARSGVHQDPRRPPPARRPRVFVLPAAHRPAEARVRAEQDARDPGDPGPPPHAGGDGTPHPRGTLPLNWPRSSSTAWPSSTPRPNGSMR